jgi:hypothetical protein
MMLASRAGAHLQADETSYGCEVDHARLRVRVAHRGCNNSTRSTIIVRQRSSDIERSANIQLCDSPQLAHYRLYGSLPGTSLLGCSTPSFMLSFCTCSLAPCMHWTGLRRLLHAHAARPNNELVVVLIHDSAHGRCPGPHRTVTVDCRLSQSADKRVTTTSR